MANIIVGLFAIALVMVAVTSVASASLSSADQVSLAWDGMARRHAERGRSELTLVSADLAPTSTNIDVSLRNSGQIVLRRFSDWDVIVRYYATSTNQGMKLQWLSYSTSSPSSGKWTVDGIYMNAAALTSEVYDPGVLNPGEEVVVRLNITPAIPTSTDNLVSIATSNGVTVTVPFSR